MKLFVDLYYGLLDVESVFEKGIIFFFCIKIDYDYFEVLYKEEEDLVIFVKEIVEEDFENIFFILLVVEDNRDIWEYIVNEL